VTDLEPAVAFPGHGQNHLAVSLGKKSGSEQAVSGGHPNSRPTVRVRGNGVMMGLEFHVIGIQTYDGINNGL
jgi:hypothetical protein